MLKFRSVRSLRIPNRHFSSKFDPVWHSALPYVEGDYIKRAIENHGKPEIVEQRKFIEDYAEKKLGQPFRLKVPTPDNREEWERLIDAFMKARQEGPYIKCLRVARDDKEVGVRERYEWMAKYGFGLFGETFEEETQKWKTVCSSIYFDLALENWLNAQHGTTKPEKTYPFRAIDALMFSLYENIPEEDAKLMKEPQSAWSRRLLFVLPEYRRLGVSRFLTLYAGVMIGQAGGKSCYMETSNHMSIALMRSWRRTREIVDVNPLNFEFEGKFPFQECTESSLRLVRQDVDSILETLQDLRTESQEACLF